MTRYSKTFATMTAIATVASMALAGTALAENNGPNNTTEYKTRDNGGYMVKSSSDMETSQGTVKAGERSVDVEVDDDGNVSKNVKTTSKTDAEGLMNAKKNIKETTYEEKSRGGYSEEAVSKQRDADGTNVTTKVKTDVDVKDDGTREKTVERTKITDPKGLMNRTKETTKTVNGRVVD